MAADIWGPFKEAGVYSLSQDDIVLYQSSLITSIATTNRQTSPITETCMGREATSRVEIEFNSGLEM